MTTEARDALVETNLGLVRMAVREFHRSRLDRDDLEAEANLALVEAATAYRSERGPFASWALFRIRVSLIRAVARNCSPGSGGTSCNLDLIPAPTEPTDTVYDELWEAIETLPGRTRSVLLMLFGLDDQPGRRSDVAGRHGVDPKTVTRIKLRALATLKQSLSA